MHRTSDRAWRGVAGGVGAATLLGLGYVTAQWLRYGHVRKRVGPPTLLDRFLPECEVLERHETRVAAPADVAYLAAREMSLAASPVVRAIFRGRELLMRSSATEERDSKDIVLASVVRPIPYGAGKVMRRGVPSQVVGGQPAGMSE